MDNSQWTSIKAVVHQGSIPGSLFFLSYINGISDDLITNIKLFLDDSSLFTVVHDMNIRNNMNNDLRKIGY